MTLRRPSRHSGLRLLGIALLMPVLFRVPLPQPDYHNVRHHHGAGEVCPITIICSDGHPSANQASDVAMLHWHWFVPRSQAREFSSGSDDDHHGPASGPALHAYLADCLEPDWKGDPVIRPDGRGRFLQHLASGSSVTNLAADSTPLTLAATHPSRAHSSIPIASACFCGDLFGLCQRWNC